MRWHELKHMIMIAAEGAEIGYEDWWHVRADENGAWPSPRERLEDIFASLLRDGLAALIGTQEDAKRFFEHLQEEFPESIVEPEQKNAGLYVDLSPTGEVLTPARVASDARMCIMTLEWYLDVFSGLPEILTEEGWGSFAKWADESRKHPRGVEGAESDGK